MTDKETKKILEWCGFKQEAEANTMAPNNDWLVRGWLKPDGTFYSHNPPDITDFSFWEKYGIPRLNSEGYIVALYIMADNVRAGLHVSGNSNKEPCYYAGNVSVTIALSQAVLRMLERKE